MTRGSGEGRRDTPNATPVPVESAIDDAHTPSPPKRRRQAEEADPLRKQQTAGSPSPDGPHPPNVFVWKGEQHSLAPRLWQLLNHMWNRDRSPVQDVWEHDSEIADSSVRSDVSKLNTRLLDIGVPLSFSTKQGYVIKSDMP